MPYQVKNIIYIYPFWVLTTHRYLHLDLGLAYSGCLCGCVTKSGKNVEVLYGWSLTTYKYLCTCFPSQFYLYFSTRIDSFFLPRVHLYTAQGCQNRFLASKTNIVAATSPEFCCYFRHFLHVSQNPKFKSGLASLTYCGGPDCITSHGRKSKLQGTAVIKSGLSFNLLQDFPFHKEKL